MNYGPPVLALVSTLFLITQFAKAQTRIDREWWKGASPELRRGAISGAFDCLTVRRHVKLATLAMPEWEERVDASMARTDTNETLAEAMQGVPAKSKRASGGEDHSKEKHGWFDSYYWGSARDDERYGFLVGYLSCGKTLNDSVERVKEYRNRIDDWYDQHPSSNAKIADVLARVRRKNVN